MIRKIVKIDEEKCNGCGACAAACHEGAIAMIDGKARLIKDDYCDGLGDCLPACPADAIEIIEREAAAYDHEAVMARMAAMKGALAKAEALGQTAAPTGTFTCPGSAAREMKQEPADVTSSCVPNSEAPTIRGRLSQWPIQIKLAPVRAPFFNGRKLLIAADCTGYAYGNFHEDFIAGRVTLIGCPKLDSGHYAEKLTEIFRQNDIPEILLTRMTVPCCGGMSMAVKQAITACGKDIPLKIVTIDTDGKIVHVEE